eukprot:TRINITY_DN6331_c0_g1_i1.p1 TRINITY_DN6331_c0_g1~~TRINITY_DN6331_c0_g1_i1.p1  ORF type:complete len:434 (+),score=138.18 TRINITY_DN6331_c0_g1_i1:33-1334(+)
MTGEKSPLIGMDAGVVLRDCSLDYEGAKQARVCIQKHHIYGAVADGADLSIKAVVLEENGAFAKGIPGKGEPWYNKAAFAPHTVRCATPEDAAAQAEQVKQWLAPEPKDIHIIVNPNSGLRKGKAIGELVAKHVQFSPHRVHLYHTTKPLDAVGIAAGLRLQEGSIVATVGGDGTMCEALQGLLQRPDAAAGKFTICYIPCGSANAMSYMTGQGDPTTAIWAMLRGRTRPLDLFKFTQGMDTRYGVLSVTSSLIADIDIDSEMCRCCGASRFLLYTIMKLFCCCCTCCSRHANLAHPMRVEYKTPGSAEWQSWEGDAQFFQVTNAPAIDAATKISPDARLDDGQLFITWSERLSRISLVGEFDRFEDKTHLDRPHWQKRTASAVRVTDLKKYSKVVIDGEACRTGEGFEMEVMPSFVNIIVGSGTLPAFTRDK